MGYHRIYFVALTIKITKYNNSELLLSKCVQTLNLVCITSIETYVPKITVKMITVM